MKHATKNTLQAFSLVELSIVLVILGLLVGGILSGQSLIRAAELRSISTDYGRYMAAVQTFRDKYFQLPGDMNNATAFWGKDNAACAGHTGTAATPGTCNGNGDGKMDAAGVVSGTGEMFQFWKQLALSGLIEGTYTGLAGASTVYQNVIGTNCPRSRISNAGFGTHIYSGSVVGNPNHYDGALNNWMFFGGAGPNGTVNYGAVLRPEEMWNVDAKLDDGKPAYGKITSTKSPLNPGCTTSDLMTAEYALTNSSIVCSITFNNNF